MAAGHNFFSSPYAAEEEGIRQQMRYAQALQQQGLQPDQGQMVSGHYVAPSWTQGLAKLGAGALSGKAYADALKRTEGVANQRQQALIDALQGYATTKDPNALLTNPETAPMGMQVIAARESEAAKAAARPPTVANVRDGKQQVSKQWDPVTKTWLEIGRGDAFAPANVGQLEMYKQVHPEDTTMAGFDAWNRANKASGASSVNTYGSPVAGVGADGKPVFFQTNKDGQVSVVPDVAPPPKATLTGKDLAAVNGKIQAAQNLKRQLADARARFAQIKGTLAAGPITGMNPFSEQGQQFDASIDALRSTVTALTRTPGVGAMSDYETRLDQAKIPTRGKYESTTEQQLQELETFADNIIRGYSDMAGTPPAGAGASGSWDGSDRRKQSADPLGILGK